MDKANEPQVEKAEEKNQPQNEDNSETELLLAQLLSMGFEDALCREAVKLTSDQEKAIELVLQFQDELQAKELASTQPQKAQNIQEMENPFDVFKPIESYKMVCLVRTDLGMGVGKIAAQVGHAVLGAYQRLIDSNNPQWNSDLHKWEHTGNAKIVLKVKSKEELADLAKKADDAGLNTYVVCDAGRTQIEAGSLTVCAIGPASSVLIDQVTSHLKLM